ncbi:MAG: alcohol dehydrogenase catalytic domain-containing protein [Deltaproteobacteria bacterium]|jgi:propanol-preferring alcohol dehydrogenase|nr:alcohol dehydrogenase catalytic domain-containing protein [Deltaproteobacteria bacterium]MBW2496895.1 alcohol dehydrogenase catalytic domain-containing protein [Deltaproteobacteria bacterium]
MTAFRLVGWQQPPEFQEVPVPVPRGDEVLVEVAAVGLCHTDVHFLSAAEGAYPYPLPFTLGHEIAGRVVATGASVTGISTDTAVAVALGPRCGRCLPCLRGEDNLCLGRDSGRGWGQDGGLARYVAIPAREAVPIGSLDPALAAPLTDAGLTAYHAVRRVAPRLRGSSTAVVIGVGGLGGFAVQFLRHLTSCRVIAIDSSEAKRLRARDLGADVVLGSTEASPEGIRELTEGLGAEAILDFVGVDATMGLALASARPGGSIAIVGAGGGKTSIGWGLLPNDCELFIPLGGTTADLHEVVAMAQAGQLRIDIERFSFDRTAFAYAQVEAGVVDGRAVVMLP